jgi:hypothetical protein
VDLKGKSIKLKVPKVENFRLDEIQMLKEDYDLFLGIVQEVIESKGASYITIEAEGLTSGFEVWIDKEYHRPVTRMILGETMVALFRKVKDKKKEVSEDLINW